MHKPGTRPRSQPAEAAEPFASGAIVMVTLNSPREKYWGAVLAISPAGLALRGFDLNSFEDVVRQVKSGDEVAAHSVFFPMHRVERIEMDARDGEIPSMQERYLSKTGHSSARLLLPDGGR
ncbi:MAG: hypothetical protein HYX26_04685 [Acidobacteriales bacterium]|nr:hypothetical protein [Terriglobales bacterium]